MSLFPAYSDQSEPVGLQEHPSLDSSSSSTSAQSKIGGGNAPAVLPSFSSFAPAVLVDEPQLPKKEPKLVKLSSDSDEDSDIQVVSSSGQKKKAKRKKKKKEKLSESKKARRQKDISSAGKREAKVWEFLNPAEIKPSVSAEEPFMFDRKRDLENLQFGSFYKRHVANYKRNVRKCLGGSRDIANLIFGLPAESGKNSRYFARKYRKYKPGERLVSRNFARDSELPAHCLTEDFIELSSTLQKDDETLIYDPSIQMYRSVDSFQKLTPNDETEVDKIDILESATFEEAELLKRARNFNKALEESPHDVTLWLSFVKFQDKAYEKDLASKSSRLKGPKDRKMTDLGLLERKMSILDKALSKNSASIALKLERMKIGREGLWDKERLRDEWRKLEFTHVNHLGMWRGYIHFCLEHFSAFSVSKISAVFDRCIEKLQTVLAGKLVTHQPFPGTQEFLLGCIFWKCYFLKSAGYTERARATLQALVEFNFYQPPEIAHLSPEEKRSFFEPFWDSGKGLYAYDVMGFGPKYLAGRPGWEKLSVLSSKWQGRVSGKFGNVVS